MIDSETNLKVLRSQTQELVRSHKTKTRLTPNRFLTNSNESLSDSILDVVISVG